MTRGKVVALVLGCVVAGMLGLLLGLQVYHAFGDHAALHELVRREALREQGQDPYKPTAAAPVAPPAAVPPASVPPAK